MGEFAAIVLAGGAGRRLGGPGKPALPVAGRPMLERVLAAVAAAAPRVVVGSAGPGGWADLPPDVAAVREDPPGGGPAAATGAGLALVGPETAEVAVLAADLPLLTAGAIGVLRRRLAESTVDGALYVDDTGRAQTLCGVWRPGALRTAVRRMEAGRGGLSGASMAALLDGLRVAGVSWTRPSPPPWFDCDTDADLRRAQEWAQ
ncbi:MAG TPA: NTP transferase domain-containing protein [Micromonosporaceae bacterium]|jgi:molybdenum cofactor guanylyltransferase